MQLGLLARNIISAFIFIFGCLNIAFAQTNDPRITDQWALIGATVIDFLGIPVPVEAPGYLEAKEAWAIQSDCYPTVIAVLSTGVDVNHPDLIGSFVASNYHKNFTVSPTSSDITDRFGDGTVLSGVIAARSDNGVGMSGACKRARILPIKVSGDNNALNWNSLADGITYASNLGVRVILIPQGDFQSPSDSPALRAARQRAYDAILQAELRGQLIIVPTPYQPPAFFQCPKTNLNSNPDFPTSWRFSNVITVAGSDLDGELLCGGSYGNNYADIAAPGDGILSTMSRNFGSSLYDFYNGTDIAAAFIASEAALVWSKNRTWDYAQVRQQILATARNMSGVNGAVRSNGVADFHEALTRTVVPPPNKPDLSILSFTSSTSSTNLMAYLPTYFNVVVKNNGPLAAGASNLVFIYNGTTISTKRIASLNANSQRTEEIGPLSFTPGTHSLKVVLDADREIAEYNEANNTSQMSINVTANSTPTPTAK